MPSTRIMATSSTSTVIAVVGVEELSVGK